MTERGESATRMVVVMMIAGLLSGIVLAWVYVGTAPRIAQNHEAALNDAVLSVVAGAVRAERHPESGVVHAAYAKDGSLAGLAVQAEGPGFMDTIRLIYGFVPRTQRIVGLQILDSRETPGLGDKIMTDPDFVGSFRDLSVEPNIVPVTREKPSHPNEVDCISGATISSKAVVRIVQQSLNAQRILLGAGQS
jgi:electron transport complex protein RnfG